MERGHLSMSELQRVCVWGGGGQRVVRQCLCSILQSNQLHKHIAITQSTPPHLEGVVVSLTEPSSPDVPAFPATGEDRTQHYQTKSC